MSILTDIHPEKEAFLEVDRIELSKVECLSCHEADQVHERQDACTGTERYIKTCSVDVQILSHRSTHSELSIKFVVDGLREASDGIVLNREADFVRFTIMFDTIN